MLNRRLATLNRFLNGSTDKCRLFFLALNKNEADDDRWEA